MAAGSTICVRVMFLETEVSRADSWEEMMGMKCGKRRTWTPLSVLEPASASHLLHTSHFDEESDMEDNPVPLSWS